MKTRDFDLGGIRFALHVEPDRDGRAVVTLFIDGEEVQDSKAGMPRDEVDDFLDRMQRAITATIQR